MTAPPFQDLLITDISGTIATAYAGKLFADYGARVVNVEPLGGFATRSLEPFLESGHSAFHGYLNANKESISTDKPTLHPAVSAADLVLVDPSMCSVDDINANVCAISWFGMDGPYSGFQGSDAAIQALTGLMLGIGEIDGPPIIPRGFHAQMLGGVSAFNGALGFLLGQLKNDAPRDARFVLDASIYEANMCLTDLGPINAYNNNPLPKRMGINRFPPTYPLGIWPCKDGWLGVTCLRPEQWQAFCNLLELDEYADVPLFQSSVARLEAADLLEPLILEKLSHHSAEDLFYRGQALRIPLARVPTMEELPGVDQYVQRRAFADYDSGGGSFQAPSNPFRLSETPPVFGGHAAEVGADNEKWSGYEDAQLDSRRDCAHELPLAGLTIVDLGMGWAGPLAARNLADLGATVIKVESCTRFDWWRSWEATPEWIADNGAEKALPYLYVNRNKLDVTLDLESERGRTLLLRLVEKADALIENYSGEVLPKLKLDYPHLLEVNPDLVMVSLTPFGAGGPWSGFRAYGSTVEHSSGLPHLSGAEDQSPTMLHVAYGDSIAGLNGTAAALTALYHKKRTGQGQYVDVSQVECLFPLAAPGFLHQSVYGGTPPRSGNGHKALAPHGVYPCKGDDAWIVIQVAGNAEWRRLCELVPGLTSLESLTSEERRTQSEEIDSELSAWTSKQDGADLMHRLQQIDVIAAVLNTTTALLSEPHLASRGYLQMVERVFVGLQPHPSPPWRVGRKPLPIRTPAPTLGEHNRDVLSGMLGLVENELESLIEAGIIGTSPRLV